MARIVLPAGLTSRLFGQVKINRVVITSLTLLLATTALVSASIPDSGTGVISGCYSKDGTGLRFIDAEAGATCKKNEIAISWNQTGPQGVKGDPGPSGAPGPAGTSSLAALQDTPCTRFGGEVGYVDITIDESNAIAMTCAPGIPHWCDTHTPDVGPHLNVTCDEIADSLSFVCDVGWVNFDGTVANGCEVEGFEPSRTAVQAFAEAYILGPHDVTVIPSCADPTIQVACPGGVAMDPAPVVHVVGSDLVIEDIGPNTFTISLAVGITTPAPIPVSGSGLSCNVTVDTSAGSEPAALVDGRLDFIVNAETGVTDRIASSNAALTHVEGADVGISGGIGCDIANALKGLFIGNLTGQIASYLDVTLCRAPDPEIFMTCPAP